MQMTRACRAACDILPSAVLLALARRGTALAKSGCRHFQAGDSSGKPPFLRAAASGEATASGKLSQPNGGPGDGNQQPRQHFKVERHPASAHIEEQGNPNLLGVIANLMHESIVPQ